MRLMHNLDIPEGDSSEVAGVEGCSSGGGGTGPQDPESSAKLQDSISDDNLVSRYSCLTSASVKSLLQRGVPQEAEVYSSQSCDWIELHLLAACISQGNWEKKCLRLMHHLDSLEGDSSEVLGACDSSGKERAGGHLSPPNVQVCRG